MILVKHLCYGLVVGGLVGGAALDLAHGQPRQAAIAILFATANALIFFWR